MSESPVFSKLVPFIPAGTDVKETIGFYEQQLGFRQIYQDDDPPQLAIVKRDAVEIFLCKNDDKYLAEQTSFRIEVKQVTQLYEELLAKGGQMIHENGKLESKPWGTQEFVVTDPSGVCITFYELTNGNAANK